MQSFSTTLQILERHKIRIPEELYHRNSELSKAAKVTATAIPGPFGGIQILFGGQPLAELQSRIYALASQGKATAESAGNEWTLLARLLTNAWTATFSFHQKAFTLVLPSEARGLGLVPKNQGEEVLIFFYGEILEIWHPDAWNALSMRSRSKIRMLEQELQVQESD